MVRVFFPCGHISRYECELAPMPPCGNCRRPAPISGLPKGQSYLEDQKTEGDPCSECQDRGDWVVYLGKWCAMKELIHFGGGQKKNAKSSA